MMFSFTRILSFLISFLLASLSGALDQHSVSKLLNGPLRNIRTFNNKVYIGETGRIAVLNKDLSLNQSASTCDRSKILCRNVNQVLLVNEERRELLICGTGNDGMCEVRSTENISVVLRNGSGKYTPLKVSTDKKRPAHGLLTTDGTVTLAVTFGEGMLASQSYFGYLTYEYAVNTRNFKDFDVVRTQYDTKALFIQIQTANFLDYVIYYKAGFQYNWNTYFVTNQKKYVGHNRYLSKLVRICQNDTDYSSYTDIVLSCLYNGVEYNLVQDAVILKAPDSDTFADSDRIFVGAFTRGNHPTSPSGDTAICATKLKEIDEEILQAKRDHAYSCTDQNRSRRYLPNLKSMSHCLSEDKNETRDYNFSCENAYPTFMYVIGNVTFSMQSSYLVPAEKGAVTTLHAANTGGDKVVIIAGTNTGYIVQMELKSLQSPLEVIDTVNVRKSVRSVHIQDDDTVYAMTSKNVFLFSRSNCSRYTTCTKTMTDRNPLCGWCVYKQRATRKSNCSDAPNHWLSSFGNCNTRMHVTPSSISVNVSSERNVTVTLIVENLPQPRSGNTYICRLKTGIFTSEQDVHAKRKRNKFSCILLLIEEHIEATLQLLVQLDSNASIVLSEAKILFFECEQFSRCGECIGRSNQQCDWCTGAVRCQPPGYPCTADLRISKDVCPQLLDTRGSHFVHAGVLTLVNFGGKYIPTSKVANQYTYTCTVSSATASSTAAAFNDSIFCSINVSQLDKQKQDQKVRIQYAAKGLGASELEDNFENFVTIYNCTMMAKDCSRCRALNKTRYSCGWCTNKNLCGYTYENCTMATTQTCPSPTVTMIVPRDGPMSGHTKITVYGYNLGSALSEIESIQVANVPCNLSDDIKQFLDTDDGDFETYVPSRLVCSTGPSANVTTGPINITVNGQVSISTVVYSYLEPVATGIIPQYGPKSGGTRVTIYGENLGVGNRNVDVLLEGRQCLRPKVMPDLPLENVFSGNFTIVCTIDGGYRGNITTVSLKIGGKTVVSEAPLSFGFVRDPVLHKISTKKAFLSGGTKITIEGMWLDHAHNATVTIADGLDSETGHCSILSKSLAICKAPRAPQGLKEELLDTEYTSQTSQSIEATCVLLLDNIRDEFDIAYYQDPIIHDLPGSDKVVKFGADDRQLTITGKMLNMAATISDVNITVGVDSCIIKALTSSSITCVAPRTKPEPGTLNAEHPEVNVTIGNIHKTVGYVKYLEDTDVVISPDVVLSAACAAAILILIISLATVLICRHYRKMKSRLQYLASQGSINSHSDTVRMSRLSPSDKERLENSALYTYINEPGVVELYNTIVADNQDSDTIATSQLSQHSLPRHLQGYTCSYVTRPQHSLPRHLQEDTCSYVPRSQNSLRLNNKITVEIQLEGTTPTDVSIVPKPDDEESYLHALYK